MDIGWGRLSLVTRCAAVLSLSIFLPGCSGWSADPFGLSEAEIDAKATVIHETVLTLDSEVDIPYNFATDELDPGTRTDLQVDLVKMREGGLDAAVFIVGVNQELRAPEAYETAKEQGLIKLNAIHRMAEDMHPDQIEIAYSADDVERIHNEGKLVALIGMVNGFVLGSEQELLDDYFDKGLRYIAFTHAGHNDLADSARPLARLDEPPTEHEGLSEKGRRLVERMNCLGIIVDVSQVTMETVKQMAELSKAPVIASHSSVYSIVASARNISDEGLLAIKETGGVIQIVAFSGYIRPGNYEILNEQVGALNESYGLEQGQVAEDLPAGRREAYSEELSKIFQNLPKATMSQYVDHIDYVVDFLGIDHVGISSDFEHGGGVIGWMDASESLNVTKELVRRGYSESDIAKIWGGNFLRVLRDVEGVAQACPRANSD